MSVLDRFKDTEKYPRQMRELGMLIILNRRQNPGIFLKDIVSKNNISVKEPLPDDVPF